MKKEIITHTAPAAIGPYSQAIRSGDLLFLSGQIPVYPATNSVSAGNIEAQTRRVCENIANILRSQNLGFMNVVKTTVFLSDMNNYPAFNLIYSEYFTPPYPARSCVEVSKLPKDVLLEIEVIASYEI